MISSFLRIIPARAGFTVFPTHRCTVNRDHPRSRGVYLNGESTPCRFLGSSPLARGLPALQDGYCAGHGIIPARAGFTVTASSSRSHTRDHPRSRGVYGATPREGGPALGSSPLARGLRPAAPARALVLGIIPARAGFTAGLMPPPGGSRDHPRSRGVYTDGGTDNDPLDGSSPLARGLLVTGTRTPKATGIIPARAGFTSPSLRHSLLTWDHPRSRGVYPRHMMHSTESAGSSPLARGLRFNPA